MSKVILCGAGCLDVSGLTLQAVGAIEQADVLVYDDLIDDEILNLNPTCQKVYVGKRKGQHSKTQDEICELLKDLAKEHSLVVRLKGGDPFVFGRAVEEMDALSKAGIPVEVIPGLTSAIAIPELVGIPLTMRNQASCFAVVTAQRSKEAGFSKEDLEWIASFKGTLIVLMGFSLADLLCRQLINAGWNPDTPAACVWSAQMGYPEAVRGDLKTLAEKMVQSQACSPAVLVFGKTASYEPFIKEDKRVIGLTCSESFKQKLACRLKDSYELVSMIEPEIIPLEWDFNSIFDQKPDWISFCSSHGAKLFLESCFDSKWDLRSLPKIACVGKGTAEVFEKAGIYPDLICKNPSTAHLAQELLHTVKENERVISFRSKAGHSDLEESLSSKLTVERVDLYDLKYVCRASGKDPDCLVFASPSSIKAWYEFHKVIPESCKVLCLSNVTGNVFASLYDHPWSIPEQVGANFAAKWIEENV